MLCCNSVPFTTKPSGKPAPLRNCWYGVLTERPRWGEISLGQRHVGGGDGTSDCERAPGTTLTSWLTDVFIEDQLQWESVSLFLGKCREAGVPNAGEFSGLHRVCGPRSFHWASKAKRGPQFQRARGSLGGRDCTESHLWHGTGLFQVQLSTPLFILDLSLGVRALRTSIFLNLFVSITSVYFEAIFTKKQFLFCSV